MAIKCIVVGQSSDALRHTRLQMGIDLAKRFDAHLNVVCVGERPDYPAGTIGRAMSLAYLEEIAETAKQRIEAMKLETQEACADLPSWEWHVEQGAVDEIIAHYANLADLLIFGQAPLTHGDATISLEVSDYLVMAASCVTLLVPDGWQAVPVGQRILIAWKNSKEAISAVRNSLPFLCDAHSTFILADAQDERVDPPGSELVAYLKRHDVQAEIYGTTRGAGGEAILNAARDCDCDLIVMGATGRTSLRAMILGGATDHVLRETSIPLLLRH